MIGISVVVIGFCPIVLFTAFASLRYHHIHYEQLLCSRREFETPDRWTVCRIHITSTRPDYDRPQNRNSFSAFRDNG